MQAISNEFRTALCSQSGIAWNRKQVNNAALAAEVRSTTPGTLANKARRSVWHALSLPAPQAETQDSADRGRGCRSLPAQWLRLDRTKHPRWLACGTRCIPLTRPQLKQSSASAWKPIASAR
jgi:hypothetical protein